MSLTPCQHDANAKLGGRLGRSSAACLPPGLLGRPAFPAWHQFSCSDRLDDRHGLGVLPAVVWCTASSHRRRRHPQLPPQPLSAPPGQRAASTPRTCPCYTPTLPQSTHLSTTLKWRGPGSRQAPPHGRILARCSWIPPATSGRWHRGSMRARSSLQAGGGRLCGSAWCVHDACARCMHAGAAAKSRRACARMPR